MTKHQERIYTLHRYFIWMNKMREHFDHILRIQPKTDKYKNRLEIEPFLYMSYWYSGLYVVIEGWQHLKLHDPQIDKLLSSPNVQLLKRYKNATFHYQDKYWSTKFTDFMEIGKNNVNWIRRLNIAFGRYFLTEIGKINQQLSD